MVEYILSFLSGLNFLLLFFSVQWVVYSVNSVIILILIA